MTHFATILRLCQGCHLDRVHHQGSVPRHPYTPVLARRVTTLTTHWTSDLPDLTFRQGTHAKTTSLCTSSSQ